MAVENKFPWPTEQERCGLRMIRTVPVIDISAAEAADAWIDRVLAISDGSTSPEGSTSTEGSTSPEGSITTARWSKPPSLPARPLRSISDLCKCGRITPEQGALLYEIRRLHEWKRRPWWDRLITRLLGGGP